MEGTDTWTRTDENIARLVDREDYWLNSEYSSWTADPDDEDAKQERERRKALGIKPPPRPILFPVGLRPQRIREELEEAAHAEMKKVEAEPPRKKIMISELLSLWKGKAE